MIARHSLRVVLVLLLALTGLQALDPTEVNGVVTVVVDRSEATRKVTLTNTSDEALTQEMLGKVPRGLGVELWEDDAGTRTHAEDLAKYFNVDGFLAQCSFRLVPASLL